jgi:O-acetyl-ADP-ribose deacetylase (regulator of RNase III)
MAVTDTDARESSYMIGDCTFRVLFGNITEHSADVLVSSDDSHLTMGGGVSAALHRAGGPAVEVDAGKLVPLALGDVAVTTAGRLPAKYIFHGVTIDLERMAGPNADCVRQIVVRCLELAEALQLRHIAFPALGTGSGGFPYELAAEAMTKAAASFLASGPRYVNEVSLVLHAWSPYGATPVDLCYEHAVSTAAQWTDSRRLGELIEELNGLLARTGSSDLRQRGEDVRRDVARAEQVLATQGSYTNSELSLNSVSHAAGDLAGRSASAVDWEDIKARETVLQLRLQSLRTQHNILIGNRNQLEERKAKYGPNAVPLDIVNALTDLLEEVSAKELEIREIKSGLAALR